MRCSLVHIYHFIHIHTYIHRHIAAENSPLIGCTAAGTTRLQVQTRMCNDRRREIYTLTQRHVATIDPIH